MPSKKPDNTVAAVYTAPALVEPLRRQFQARLPDVRLVHIVDDRLIFDIKEKGRVDGGLEARILALFEAGARAADLVFCTCSSIGEIADKAAQRLAAPVLKIDEPMAEEAVRRATRIGVLATLSTTLEPTLRLLERKAREAGEKVELIPGLAEGAYEAAAQGDAAAHDDRVADAAQALLVQEVELLVLAQGSMARLEERLRQETGKTVLSSTASGIERVAEWAEA